jgi:nucleoside-diphosphate-sugar epimerase
VTAGRTVLVTGAAGFVGRRVIADLAGAGWRVRAVVRRLPPDLQAALTATAQSVGHPGDQVAAVRPVTPAKAGVQGVDPTGFRLPPERRDGNAATLPLTDLRIDVQWLALGDLAEIADWSAALAGVDAVVHLAGRAHVMQDEAADPLAEYRRVNVEATLALARAAATAGVRRFVFMSSVKAVGESSSAAGLAEDCPPRPEDAYGISKREAEAALLAPGALAPMTVTALRPPLVYGPGVRANFARLLQTVVRGVPLPFGGLDNRRSLVFVGNLSSAVAFAIDAPALAGQACFVTDGEDVSTPELIRRIAAAQGRPARLLPVPPAWLRAGLALAGRRAEADRLLGSLALRMERLPAAGWRPPFTMAQGLAETVRRL